MAGNYREGHNGVSTVNKENENLHFLYFWRNPKNNLGGQDHQKVYTCFFTLMGSSKFLLVMEE